MTRKKRTRRGVLRGATIGLGLAGLGVPVQGRSSKENGKDKKSENGTEGGKIPLVDGPAEFKVYVAEAVDTADDPDEASDFDYPNGPTLASEDPKGGLFDASEIEKTPNGKTLHHTLQFFQGVLIEDGGGKPYVLVHEEGGRFTEKGQHLNFEARTTKQLQSRLKAAGFDPALADREPLATLAGNEWRAVGNEVVQFVGDPETSRRIGWSVTRIDFYSRGGGQPEYELSVLYVIYPNLDEDGDPTRANPRDPTFRSIPPATRQTGRDLITDGRANLGGRSRPG